MVLEVVVHLAAGRGYVWSADDVKLLREQCRFIGALIGPNTGNTHQEHMPHSLPLLLLPEELQLGLKRGWFLIAPDPLPLAVLSQAPAPTPSPEDLEKVSEERQSEATAETNTSEREVQQPNVQGRASDRVLTFEAEAEKPEETSAVIDTEHLTTASRRVVENETVESKDRGACEEVSSSPSALEDQGEIVPGIGDTTVGGDGDAGSQAAAATHKPSAPASQPAKKKKGNKEEEYWLSFAGSTQKNVLTKLPSSNGPAMPGVPAPPHEESDRYVVYEDMYIRGYTITSGTNFGGNFLAYAGDPMDYHSEFVVRVLSKASRIPFPSLSAASRVALTARKKFLIALVTRKEGGSEGWQRQVQYFVIAPDLVTASGVSRGLRAVHPPPPPRKRS